MAAEDRGGHRDGYSDGNRDGYRDGYRDRVGYIDLCRDGSLHYYVVQVCLNHA